MHMDFQSLPAGRFSTSHWRTKVILCDMVDFYWVLLVIIYFWIFFYPIHVASLQWAVHFFPSLCALKYLNYFVNIFIASKIILLLFFCQNGLVYMYSLSNGSAFLFQVWNLSWWSQTRRPEYKLSQRIYRSPTFLFGAWCIHEVS